jgi:eukaryotic-like serine/threonine-protein kinase
VKDVAQATSAWDSDDLTLAGQYAVSSDGMLAYLASPPGGSPDRELVVIDRGGRVTPIGAPARAYRNRVALSPDGTRLAVSIQSAADVRPFLCDVGRGSLTRIAETLEGEVIVAAWSRDDRIAVQVVNEGKISAAVVRPDQMSPATPVAGSTGFWAGSWSPAGRLAGMRSAHVWIFTPLAPAAPPDQFTSSKATEVQPSWSPDGRWIAYASNATGRSEICLRPYPGPGDAVAVSTNGGSNPAWNPDSRELFYIEPGAGQDRMMHVALSMSGVPTKPAMLFSFEHDGLFLGTALLTPYAVAPGGRQFYAVRQLSRAPAPPADVDVVLNWFEDLKTKVPPLR